MKTTKQWYQSKTKWGALLIGVGTILGTLGAYFSGNIDLGLMATGLSTEVGAVLAIFGIRNALD